MGARVLLLDDDAGFVADARTALEKAGCRVVSAPDGHAGLVRAVAERFDVIVASAVLPGIDGFAFCNRIKNSPVTRRVAVVLLTAGPLVSEAAEHEQLATRADAYLQKPVTVDDLVAHVRQSSKKPSVRPGAARSSRHPPAPAGSAARLKRGSPNSGKKNDVGPTKGTSQRPPSSPRPPSPSSLPPQRPRASTIVGVGPGPRTQPPRAPRSTGAETTVQRLAHDLSVARQEAEATASLRARVAELEATVADLTRDLTQARANVSPEDALRRTRSSAPPPADIASLRDELRNRDYELLALRTAIESEQQAAAEAWERVRVAEASASSLEASKGRASEELIRAEKRLAEGAAHQAILARRVEEAVRRAQSVEEQLGKAREEVDGERRARESAREVWAAERAVRAGHGAGRPETENVNDRIAAMQSAHAVAVAKLQSERDAELARLRSEHELETERLRQRLAAERSRSADPWSQAPSGAPGDPSDTRNASTALAASEERRVREVADARAATEAALARLDHEQVKWELQRDAAIADATLELRLSLAKALKERDEAATIARGQAAAEIRIELEGAHAAAIAEIRRLHMFELERIGAEKVKAIAEIQGRMDAIERALGAARLALGTERRARIEERTAAASRIDALEQLTVARGAEIDQVREDAEAARSEGAALRAEIAGLRSELAEARRAAHVSSGRSSEAEAEAVQDARDRAPLVVGGAATSERRSQRPRQ